MLGFDDIRFGSNSKFFGWLHTRANAWNIDGKKASFSNFKSTRRDCGNKNQSSASIHRYLQILLSNPQIEIAIVYLHWYWYVLIWLKARLFFLLGESTLIVEYCGYTTIRLLKNQENYENRLTSARHYTQDFKLTAYA